MSYQVFGDATTFECVPGGSTGDVCGPDLKLTM